MCIKHYNLGRKWKGWGKGGQGEKEIVCILPDTQTQKKKRKQRKTSY